MFAHSASKHIGFETTTEHLHLPTWLFPCNKIWNCDETTNATRPRCNTICRSQWIFKNLTSSPWSTHHHQCKNRKTLVLHVDCITSWVEENAWLVGSCALRNLLLTSAQTFHESGSQITGPHPLKRILKTTYRFLKTTQKQICPTASEEKTYKLLIWHHP